MSKKSAKVSPEARAAGDSNQPADVPAPHAFAEGHSESSHSGTGDHEGHHGGDWPERSEELDDALLERLRAAFATTDVNALHSLLRYMPREPLQYVMRSLGLTNTAKLNRGMASALLTRLRTRPAVDTVRMMFSPFVYVFDHAHLPTDEWKPFLEGTWDDVIATLEGAPAFAVNLNGLIRFPEDMYHPGLVITALTSPNWVPALAMLALADEDAAALYAKVRAQYPDLPVAVRTLEETLPQALAGAAPDGEAADRLVRAVAGDLFETYVDESEDPAEGTDADVAAIAEDSSEPVAAGEDCEFDLTETDASAPAEQDHPSTSRHRFDFGSLADQSLRMLGSHRLGLNDGTGWDAGGWSVSGWGLVATELQGADIGSLLDSVDDLDWADAAHTAARVSDDLEDGTAPNPADVAALNLFTRRTHTLADRLTVHVQYPVEPTAESLTAAAADLRADDENTLLIRSLVEATGPAGFDGPMDDLRSLASSALAGDEEDPVVDSLAALARLAALGAAQRGAQTREYAQISALESSARQSLPPAVLPVLPVAMLGDLTLGPADETATATPDASHEPAQEHATEPTAEPDSQPADPQDTIPDAEPEAGDEASDKVSGAVDEERTAESDHAAPEGPGAASDTAPVKEVEFDLADLEAFLTTPAAKSARRKDKPATLKSPDSATTQTWSAAGTSSRDDAPAVGPGTELDPKHETPDDTTAEDHAALRQLEADLLGAGRFGLASLLHRDPAHAAARRVAAYQAHLTASTGDLATAFADDQPLITRDALGGDQPGQILAWAAAARVSVLAPAAAAHQVLLELAPRVADYPNLAQLGADLATASLNGAIAVPDHGEDVTNHHAATAAAQNAVNTARNLLSVAGQRNIKYLPANHVYQDWMAPEGVLGELLGTVIANDPDQASATQQKIVDLRRGVDKTIDDTVAKVMRSSSKGRRIEAGARQTLRKRLDEALDIVSEWANAVISEAEISDWLKGSARAQRPLENLRRSVAEIRAGALDEITQLAEDCDTSTDSGRLEAAAASAAASMILATFAAIDGNPPQGPELSPAWVVRGELLATDERLDPRSLHVIPAPHAHDPDDSHDAHDPGAHEQALVVDLAAQPVATLDDLYRARTRRNEHDLTEVIVAAATRIDEQTAIQLRVEREEDVTAAQAAMLAKLEATISTVNVLRREETLPQSVWSSLLADLDALKAPHRRDFATIEAELTRVRSVVERHKTRLMTQARERIEAKAASDPLVAQHRQTLLDVVDRGDVAGADEYLEQLTSGAALPDTRDDDRDLCQFFPAVPDLLVANPGLLADLHSALSGKTVTDPVRELFRIAGTDPTITSSAGRSAAQAALGAWAPLAGVGSGKKGVEVTGAVKAVLAALGLEFAHGVELDADKPVGRRFGTLREVLPTGGKAMAPALGSHMGGPGGSSLRLLLVWRAETPATILEWLSHQREDQTVLVLYLAGTLSAEQRRALATGARGRPRPVAIVVDAAVLAYLACQPEPSRTALAFTTLPFTAASPYRDTPGDTPPEMFYGRLSEQRAVLDLVGSSFVSGGRQLGKSALLRSAQRAFDHDATRRALFIEIRQVGADDRPEAIWPRLAAELRNKRIAPDTIEVGTATAESVSAAISAWLREDPDRALLVLIDEADNFLHADADDNFTHVGACKQLMTQENRRVKFVFAGLHRTARFESLSNQPLAHMGKPIVVGPLQPQAAQDLITRPMAAMGFTFENARTQTARILAATNSVPSLLQLFGEALIEHMTKKDVEDGPPQRVTDEDISTVLDDKELVARFRERYILTLNLDHRYQVIVHAVALAAHDNGVDSGLRLSEIADQCHQYWPAGFAHLSVDYLRGLVTECCDLGLLTLDDGRYRMRTPYVLRLLGTAEEVAEVLYDAEERLTLPSSLDAGSYRDSIPGTNHRAPLTARQLGELFTDPGSTRIVVGTEALGVAWTAPHLVGYSERGRSGEFTVQQVKQWTPDSLRSHARMLTKPTMLVADMRTASSAAVSTMLAAEADAAAATTMPLIIVLLVTPNSLPAWMHDDDRIVELTRVDQAGMRLWCEESDATFDTPEEWSDLAATTGGWPSLLEYALNPAASAASTPAKRLEDLRTRLSEPTRAAEVVAACGLGGDDPVSAALTATFNVTAYWTDSDPASRDDLLDFLADDKKVVSLVKAAGLVDVDKALRVLQSIGAVVSTSVAGSSISLVSTEPVLTAAMRCAQPEVGPAHPGTAGATSGERQ